MAVNINIREILPEDKPQILELFTKFGAFFVNLDPLKRCVARPGYAKHFYGEMIEKVTKLDGIVYVALSNETIVGFVAGIIKHITPETDFECIPLKQGRVLELFVEESYRGQRIGTQLLRKMEDYLKSKQCDTINISVFAPNQAAYQFYKQFGYQDRNIDLTKNIHD